MKKEEQYRDNLFYNSSKLQIEFAGTLRKTMTNSEKKLWQHLRNKKIKGFHFRRQHAMGQFVADFYCHKAKLLIEVDGEIHNTILNKNYDKTRDKIIKEQGITVMRFSNNEILNSIDRVIEKVKNNLK